MTKNSYEKDLKELEAFDNHNFKTYMKTCLHHTDKERLDAGCPVCQHRRVTELEVEKSRLQDSLDRLAVLWARETLDDYQQLELENARLREALPDCLAMAEAWEDSEGGKACELIERLRKILQTEEVGE
jgi:hypothetical protein